MRLHPDDFEIERTENLTRSVTVLMLDLSLSMPMRDNFLAAKKVAMALHSLISSQFPRDFLGIVGFSEVARELKRRAAARGVVGLRLRHEHAARVPAQPPAARPPDRHEADHHDHRRRADRPHRARRRRCSSATRRCPRRSRRTLREVARCTRDGIRINTFMLDANSYLKAFVEKLTQMNRGRAFFTTPETLGDYVLVDFIEQKRADRGRGPPAGRAAVRRGSSTAPVAAVVLVAACRTRTSTTSIDRAAVGRRLARWRRRSSARGSSARVAVDAGRDGREGDADGAPSSTATSRLRR